MQPACALSDGLSKPSSLRLRAGTNACATVLLTAHIGNYDAVRGSFAMAGQTMAALYKPMRNTIFNDHYVKAVKQIASPAFPTTARGLASLISHLKKVAQLG
jgi:KDO2-lipid IV(A) lauroyltransferase